MNVLSQLKGSGMKLSILGLMGFIGFMGFMGFRV